MQHHDDGADAHKVHAVREQEDERRRVVDRHRQVLGTRAADDKRRLEVDGDLHALVDEEHGRERRLREFPPQPRRTHPIRHLRRQPAQHEARERQVLQREVHHVGEAPPVDGGAVPAHEPRVAVEALTERATCGATSRITARIAATAWELREEDGVVPRLVQRNLT